MQNDETSGCSVISNNNQPFGVMSTEVTIIWAQGKYRMQSGRKCSCLRILKEKNKYSHCMCDRIISVNKVSFKSARKVEPQKNQKS